MGNIRVAIVGVGNCASSLVQGVEYYKNASADAHVPGLMHVTFGDYHVGDVEFVAAFDVDAKKVGFDLSEAINNSENNTIKIADVPPTGVIVQRGHTLDGVGKYYAMTIDESPREPVDVAQALRDAEVDVLVCTDGEARCQLVGTFTTVARTHGPVTVVAPPCESVAAGPPEQPWTRTVAPGTPTPCTTSAAASAPVR